MYRLAWVVFVMSCGQAAPAGGRQPSSAGKTEAIAPTASLCKRYLAAWALPPNLIDRCVAQTRSFAVASVDTCVRYAENAREIMVSVFERTGAPTPTADKLLSDLVECTQNASHPLVSCAASASSKVEVEACLKDMYALMLRIGSASSERPEVVPELERMGELAKVAFAKNRAFPIGTAELTPATSCCASPTRLCPTIASEWTGPWAQLGYVPGRPDLLYQYTYASDGTKLTITGVGDMDCDDTVVTYTLEAKVKDDRVELVITKPPLGVD